MTANDKTGLVIACILGLVFVVLSIIMLTGKGSSLIAGYNTMSKDEKEKYDKVRLSKFIGKIFLPIGLLTPLTAVSGILEIPWLTGVYIAVTVGLSTFAVIYANTGNRFRK